ncbi:hypothetical protein KGQ25_02625 [Patescibacteria group bacterium]|nr:hypothetical protein [Patescibacteria group bacterium]MDE2173529.1 hypothetical protein [Patescibacteria group bacterium]
MGTPHVGAILQKESYIAMVRNAEGTRLFRNLYAAVDGKRTDIVRDGDLSCAFFVSSILCFFRLIATPHATVSGLVRDLESSGWRKTEIPMPGDIIVWEPLLLSSGETHPHIGFFLGGEKAVSNDSETQTPINHHVTFGARSDGTPVRAIVALYTRDF